MPLAGSERASASGGAAAADQRVRASRWIGRQTLTIAVTCSIAQLRTTAIGFDTVFSFIGDGAFILTITPVRGWERHAENRSDQRGSTDTLRSTSWVRPGASSMPVLPRSGPSAWLGQQVPGSKPSA